MKNINRENYEMLMFDLLEGNISEPQRTELLNQIEADPFYKTEWAGWQQTVLPGESMTFEHKSKLKKRTGLIFFRPLIRYAAAACLLLAAITFIYTYSVKDQIQPVSIKEHGPRKGKTPVKEMPVQVADTTSTLKSEIIRMADKKKSRIIIYPNNNEIVKKQNLNPIIIEQEENKNENIIVKVPNVETKEPESELKIIEQTKVLVDNEDHNTLKTDSTTYAGLIPVAPSRTLGQRIGDKRRKIAAFLQRPNISFEKTAESRTGYSIVIENKEYKVIAGF